MTSDPEPGGSRALSPDEAFAVLGDETRLQILQALGDADGPLAYSELFDRIAYDDTANFTYHLEKLVGHFVRKTDEGYVLRLVGRRVVEAILSGVVTDNPMIERTEVDMPCMYCGGPAEIGYHEELVVLYCSACEGQIQRSRAADAKRWPIPAQDIVGYVSLPPSGVYDRTPTEILEAAGVWTVPDIQSIARGVCPRCAAALDRRIHVCDDHDGGDGFCTTCGHRFGVNLTIHCRNCIFETGPPYPTYALGTTDLLGFMIEHGVDPFALNAVHLSACEEQILSTDPLEAQYTFTIDDESLTLTVDEDLSVTDVTRRTCVDTGE